MASFSGRIRDYLRVLTVVALVTDVLIIGLYYNRVSTFFQDTVSSAYDVVGFGLEAHQVYAAIVALALTVIILGFWFMAMRSFRYKYKAFYLLVPIFCLGNLGVFGFDGLLVYSSLENSQGGFGSQPVSDHEKYFFYISAAGLAMLHQIFGALTIWCLVVGRTEESMYEGLQEGDRVPVKPLVRPTPEKPVVVQSKPKPEPVEEEFSFQKPYSPPLADPYKKLVGQISDTKLSPPPFSLKRPETTKIIQQSTVRTETVKDKAS